MGAQSTGRVIEPALERFAELLRKEVDAVRVLLFGSHARGQASAQSDYDIIVVSPRFAGVPSRDRGLDLRRLWRAAGGYGPMDIICLTPDEFASAQHRITLVAAVMPEAIDLLPAIDQAGSDAAATTT